MKKLVSLLLCAIVLFGCCVFPVNASSGEEFVPYVIDFSLTSPTFEIAEEQSGERVSGLILMYGVRITATGTSLKLEAQTNCISTVVKSGVKNFVVQRKKVTSGTWLDYYDYGDIYTESFSSNVSTTLVVESGYQYRVSCKHYAKKSLLVTQSISNTSNVVAV